MQNKRKPSGASTLRVAHNEHVNWKQCIRCICNQNRVAIKRVDKERYYKGKF